MSEQKEFWVFAKLPHLSPAQESWHSAVFSSRIPSLSRQLLFCSLSLSHFEKLCFRKNCFVPACQDMGGHKQIHAERKSGWRVLEQGFLACVIMLVAISAPNPVAKQVLNTFIILKCTLSFLKETCYIIRSLSRAISFKILLLVWFECFPFVSVWSYEKVRAKF